MAALPFTMRQIMRFSSTILITMTALTLSACGPSANQGSSGQAGSTVISTGAAQIGGPFTLMDETGAVVTEAEFEGKATLVYFGFSHKKVSW